MNARHYEQDNHRCTALDDVGGPNYLAATLIDRDGRTHLALLSIDKLRDRTAHNQLAQTLEHRTQRPMTDSDDDWRYQLDKLRSADLTDAGAPDHLAAVALDADGTAHYVLAHRPSLTNPDVRFDHNCPRIEHEQLDQPLPLEMVRRLAIAARKHRNDKPEGTTR